MTTNSPHRVLAVGQTKHPLSLERRPQQQGHTEGEWGVGAPQSGCVTVWVGGHALSPGTLASLPSDASSKRDGSSPQWLQGAVVVGGLSLRRVGMKKRKEKKQTET